MKRSYYPRLVVYQGNREWCECGCENGWSAGNQKKVSRGSLFRNEYDLLPEVTPCCNAYSSNTETDDRGGWIDRPCRFGNLPIRTGSPPQRTTIQSEPHTRQHFYSLPGASRYVHGLIPIAHLRQFHLPIETQGLVEVQQRRHSARSVTTGTGTAAS